LVRCEICGRVFADRRGLSSHVTAAHDIPWPDYREEYPVGEAQEEEFEAFEEDQEPEEEAPQGLNERLERLEAIVNRFMSGTGPSGGPSGIREFPAEDVEVIGERLNYKVALNPAIFSRYDKFKAVCLKRGNQWNGDFADFLDMATKDILAVFGIYDTVVEFRGGKYLIEVPAEVPMEARTGG